MNILHLLSQNHLTGAEVYAVQLIEAQSAQADQKLYQVSNGFYAESKALQYPLPVETKSKWQFIQNVFWLRRFIKNNEVHIIHSHSRAAAKLAFYSTLFSKTAHVSSVHGIQHSSFSKKLLNQYGQITIAVCDNIKSHLIQDFSYREESIKVIPNPISEKLYRYEKKQRPTEHLSIVIIGRSTGPKGLRTQQVIDALCSPRFNQLNWTLDIIGADQKHLQIKQQFHNKIRVIQEPVSLSSEVYKYYDLIIGSGRVCMEALITGRPVIAFGEALYLGLSTEENLQIACQSNFGDISSGSLTPQIDLTQFEKDLHTSFQNKADPSTEDRLESLSKKVNLHFSLSAISKKVQRVYESAYFLKQYPYWIPVLMYHKVPTSPLESQHKIFVTQENFEKHLLFFKKLGFTSLTFSELTLFRKGLISFKSFPKKPLILTFDDGYRDNLENASPLLKKFGFKAQLFLLADSRIDSNIWDKSETEDSHEIISGTERQLWKTSAFEIGSHGFSHEKLTDLTEENAFDELKKSKSSLEQEFSTSVPVYAFTYGITTEASRRLAETAGYDYAVNTDSGGHLIEEDPFAIFRVNIFPDENFWSLFKKTSRWYRRYYYFKRKK